MRGALKPIGDMERILTRGALRPARPRDLTRLLSSLAALPQLRSELSHCDAPRLQELYQQAGDYPETCDLLVQFMQARGVAVGQFRAQLRQGRQ